MWSRGGRRRRRRRLLSYSSSYTLFFECKWIKPRYKY